MPGLRPALTCCLPTKPGWSQRPGEPVSADLQPQTAAEEWGWGLANKLARPLPAVQSGRVWCTEAADRGQQTRRFRKDCVGCSALGLTPKGLWVTQESPEKNPQILLSDGKLNSDEKTSL